MFKKTTIKVTYNCIKLWYSPILDGIALVILSFLSTLLNT
uniref:Uncharacterized protein MANES_06G174700 n=1 Tax=Rhizophora mucronata TaxID=61149 RepID=A0A2P2MEF7_RHIMU